MLLATDAFSIVVVVAAAAAAAVTAGFGGVVVCQARAATWNGFEQKQGGRCFQHERCLASA